MLRALAWQHNMLPLGCNGSTAQVFVSRGWGPESMPYPWSSRQHRLCVSTPTSNLTPAVCCLPDNNKDAGRPCPTTECLLSGNAVVADVVVVRVLPPLPPPSVPSALLHMSSLAGSLDLVDVAYQSLEEGIAILIALRASPDFRLEMVDRLRLHFVENNLDMQPVIHSIINEIDGGE